MYGKLSGKLTLLRKWGDSYGWRIFKNQLQKRLTTLAILSLLDQRQMYGYGLVQALDQRSGGNFTMRETALYPVLYRLIDSTWSCAEQTATPQGASAFGRGVFD